MSTELVSTLAAVSRESAAPLVLEELTLEAPRAGEVVVDVAFAGVCHTDIAAHHGFMGTHQPAVLGHEGVGVVVGLGAGVTSVAVGDRVLMSFTSCGHCVACKDDDPAYCESAFVLNMLAQREDGSSAYSNGVHSHFFGQSAFATRTIATERNIVPLPDDVPFEHAAAMGCGVITGASSVLNVLQVQPGQAIGVFGCGGVGLAAVMAARIAGAEHIVAVDVVDSRLELAAELGATATLRADLPDLVDQLRAVTEHGLDGTIEASGNDAARGSAVEALGRRGVCVIVGAGAPVGSIGYQSVQLRGVTVRGTIEGDADPQTFVPQLFDYYREGRFPVERLSQLYPFADINQAFADAEAGTAVKPILRMR